jgi:uncharacterized membrane protein YsdA (DUF1294 family)/cold shock CspA family protein
MHKQGKVVRWQADKGFGFIRSLGPGADVFFHVRDFRSGLGGTPAVGMDVSFEEIHVGGKGPRAMAVVPLSVAGRARPTVRGRDLAQRRAPVAPSGRVRAHKPMGARQRDPWLGPLMLLALAQAVLMAWAVWQRHLPLGVCLGWVLLNLFTFWCYWHDKHAAQKGHRRTPENQLHTLSLLGGWPAARLAQQVLRHKSSKTRFQRVYWVTTVAHVAALLAYLYVAQSDVSLLKAALVTLPA